MFLFFLLFLLLCDFSQNLSEWSPCQIPFSNWAYRPGSGVGGKSSPAMTQAYTQIMAEMNAFLTI